MVEASCKILDIHTVFVNGVRPDRTHDGKHTSGKPYTKIVFKFVRPNNPIPAALRHPISEVVFDHPTRDNGSPGILATPPIAGICTAPSMGRISRGICLVPFKRILPFSSSTEDIYTLITKTYGTLGRTVDSCH